MAQTRLLAISVGNTRTGFGVFHDGELLETATHENGRHDRLTESLKHAMGALGPLDGAHLLMGSVNPEAETFATELVKRETGQVAMRVETDVNIPIGRQLDREAMVGEDRLLAAAAAFDVLKQACVVVDAGTAITVDFIDGAGTFHGGAIAPGGQLQLDSLTQRAANLPEVELAEPEEIIGHNTVEAMRLGVVVGARGMVRALVERYADHAGHFPTVIATGGDAHLLFREDELVDRVVPDLALRGLWVTLRSALDEAGQDEA